MFCQHGIGIQEYRDVLLKCFWGIICSFIVSFCTLPFIPQGSGHNDSSNQSLCSIGSLSDKELEVGLLLRSVISYTQSVSHM